MAHLGDEPGILQEVLLPQRDAAEGSLRKALEQGRKNDGSAGKGTGVFKKGQDYIRIRAGQFMAPVWAIKEVWRLFSYSECWWTLGRSCEDGMKKSRQCGREGLGLFGGED